jgi:predicted ATP-dependent serine protease
VRPVLFPDLRLKEAAMLGFRSAVIPAGPALEATSLEVTAVSQLQAARETLFGR